VGTLPLSESALILKVNEQANQLIFIFGDSTNELHKNKFYLDTCDVLDGLIKKISKFEILLLVWQHVVTSLNESIKMRLYKKYELIFIIIFHIFSDFFPFRFFSV